MSTRLARQLLFAGASLIALTAGAEAAVFNLNRTIGGGSVVGTVTTDGTLGVLAQGNITDWSLALNDGSNTFTLLGPSSGNNSRLVVVGTALSATATQLMFDFAAPGLAIFQNPNVGSGINWYCVEGPASGCTVFGNNNGASETVTVSARLTSKM